ncbi:MAG: hypothetical protein WD407_12505 [Rhodospirillales bacterium]
MNRFGVAATILLAGLAGLYIVYVLTTGIPLRTDLLAFLPAASETDAGKDARTKLSRDIYTEYSRQVVILIGHVDARRSRAEARRYGRVLAESPIFSHVDLEVSRATPQAFAKMFRKSRSGLLSDADREALRTGRTADVVRRAYAQVFDGFGLIGGDWLRHDPLLLTTRYVSALPGLRSSLRIADGMLSVTDAGITWTLIRSEVAGDVYALDTQEAVIAVLARAAGTLSKKTRVLRAGAVFHAYHGAKSGIEETSLIAVVALFGVIFMLIWVFRSVGPLLMNIGAIVLGLVFGTAVVILVFGHVHVMTLLLGTSLVGISIDYGIHYCCERFESASPRDRLARILPGITLGFATTLIGYFCFIVSPLPGFRQLAVFTVSGLAMAFCVVVFWFPRGDRMTDVVRMPLHRETFENIAAALANPRTRHLLIAATVLFSAFGIAQVKIVDDVRKFQRPAAHLVAAEREVVRLSGAGRSPTLLLVDAADDQKALEVEESLDGDLQSLKKSGDVSDWIMVSDWVPSIRRQKENTDLVRAAWQSRDMQSYLQSIGLGSEAFPGESGFVTVDDLAAVPALRRLVRGAGKHIVVLNGAKESALAARLARHPFVHILNPAGDINLLLQRYRQRALWLLAAAVALIVPVLAFRYGLASAGRVIFPSLLAIFASIGAAGWFGVPFTLFGALGLILILSIGVDYAIFFRESASPHRAVTLLAVGAAGMTTVLSFGLLTASSLTAIRGFGLTLLVGVLVCVLLSPGLAPARSVEERAP